MGMLVAAFCTATVLAQAALVGYGAMKGYLTQEKVSRMIAVAQGAELIDPTKKDAKPAADQARPEQPSYEQLLEARAVKSRNLELREQAVVNATTQLRLEQTKLSDAQGVFKKDQQVYSEQLAAEKKHSTDLGWDTNRRDLGALKPKLAKEQILLMIKKDEMRQVVSLLLTMPDPKRAKIFAEFKNPEEQEKLEEILRLIRQGEPVAGIAASAEQRLNGGPAAGNQEGRQ
jgi:hypothetical protein